MSLLSPDGSSGAYPPAQVVYFTLPLSFVFHQGVRICGPNRLEVLHGWVGWFSESRCPSQDPHRVAVDLWKAGVQGTPTPRQDQAGLGRPWPGDGLETAPG